MKKKWQMLIKILVILSLTLQVTPLIGLAETITNSVAASNQLQEATKEEEQLLYGQELAAFLANYSEAEQVLELKKLTKEQVVSLEKFHKEEEAARELADSSLVSDEVLESTHTSTAASFSERQEIAEETTTELGVESVESLTSASESETVTSDESEEEAEGPFDPSSITSFLSPGPLMSAFEQGSTDNLQLSKKATYNPSTKQVDFQLEAYAKGSIVTEMRPTDVVLVLDTSGSMAESFGKVTKIGALRTAVNGFADTLFSAANNPSADQYHTIKLVTYNSNATLNSQTFQTNRPNDREKLKEVVKNLRVNGQTRHDLGMSRAESAVKANRSSAKQAVILFTDGRPEASGYSAGSIAGAAINSAYRLKNNLAATIYTVGIQNNANPYSISSSDIPNSMLNGISSNYLKAQVSNLNNYRDTLALGDYSNNGTYYLTPNNANDLANIFQQIATEMGKIEGLSLRDILSEELFLPTVDNIPNNLSGVKVYRSWEYQPGLKAETDVQLNYQQDSKSLTIENLTLEPVIFDGNQQPTPATRNNKIIIRFSSDIQPDFMGGNQVLTNQAESGAFTKNEDGSETEIKRFEQPKVNIPLKASGLTSQNQKTYIGNQTSLSDFFTKAQVLDGKNNRYTTVTYQIKQAGKMLVEKTIPAGTAFKDEAFSQVAVESQDTVYDLTYRVSSALPPLSGTTGVADINKSEKSEIYLFYPEIKALDRKIYFTNQLDQRQQLPKIINWQHSKASELKDLRFVGKEPSVIKGTYELPTTLTPPEVTGRIKTVQLSNQKIVSDKELNQTTKDLIFKVFIFTPTVTSTNTTIDLGSQTILAERLKTVTWENKLTELAGIEGEEPLLTFQAAVLGTTTKLTKDSPEAETAYYWQVNQGATDISSVVTFLNNDYQKNQQLQGAHFTIDVRRSQLVINKEIKSSEQRNFGEESFIFEITWSKGDVSETYHQVITLAGNQRTGTATLSSLKPGNYQVKELTEWSSRYLAETKEFQLALTGDQKGSVTFVNVLNNNQWLTHESQVENKFQAK